MKKITILLLFILTQNIYSQYNLKKTVKASRIENSPSIDGILDESFWLGADIAKDFVMFRPGDGDKETDRKTEVRVAYDDNAIYFGATMYDPNPSSIPTQFTSRDNFGNADFFLISLNPNNDGQNDTEFLVSSAGTQGDAKITSHGEDWSWSSVWESSVKINEDSWVVEMRIPYSALRFSNSNVQTWGLNMHRKIQSTNEQFVWNYIDKSSGLFTQFNGEIDGIENIKPPVRLSFSPYASASNTTFDGDQNFDYSYGMDLKYGISESFTLDATLIPDFGQTEFDDVVLNLGPFEQQYEEKRSFFTEGTELFNKGNLFYSRRIGNNPTGQGNTEDELNSNEEIIDNPSKVDMLNAIKVSGRTKGNLGIGIFNAITEKTYAKVKNLDTDEIQKILTEPFANYNVVVLDQQFNKTSSVTLVNTNVLREGDFRDANTTAILLNALNKKNTHFVDGSIKVSNIYEDNSTSTGFYGDVSIGKSSGKHQYEVGLTKVNDRFNINDLGFNSRTNYQRYYGRYSHRIFEPKGKFDVYGINVWANVNFLDKPYTYTSNRIGFNFWGNTTKRQNLGFNTNLNLGKSKDYYEPRTEDFSRFQSLNSSMNFNGWFSTDFSKKFAFRLRIGTFQRFGKNEESSYSFSISPRYRFSDKFQIGYELEINREMDEKGWVNTNEDDSIIFGNRDSKTITNGISGSYNFNTKSALNLTFRHYWSPVDYDNEFYELNNDGKLIANNYSDNHNINYNIWNFDLSYSWEFAPGSQLIAFYRNSLFKEDELSHLKFGKNLNNLFEEPIQNNFSLKFIYYLDYNKLKRWI